MRWNFDFPIHRLQWSWRDEKAKRVARCSLRKGELAEDVAQWWCERNNFVASGVGDAVMLPFTEDLVLLHDNKVSCCHGGRNGWACLIIGGGQCQRSHVPSPEGMEKLMDRLALYDLPTSLAWTLHSSDDEVKVAAWIWETSRSKTRRWCCKYHTNISELSSSLDT